LENRRIVIRGSGAAYIFTISISAIVMILFLLDAVWRAATPGSFAIWLACAAGFAVFLLRTLTTQVVLDGNEISYRGWFRATRSLRRDQIAAAKMIAKRGYRIDFRYLLLEPIEAGALALSIRTDLFSHADVQRIRSFLGEKLKQR
jgi:hypothetical protein